MTRKIQIGNRKIGDGEPCFIIAEAGSNHNGRFEQAQQLIDVAAGAGVDAVKFQLFRANRLYPKNAGSSDYLKVSKPIYDLIAEMELPYEWIPELAAYCKKREVLFMASVFDEESADRLDPYVAAHKIASYEMTHIPLIRHVAKRGKPVIISTGAAHLDEVAETVSEFRKTGNENLILMQCTAAYPTPLEFLNVRVIGTLKSTFGVPAGLSDHSRDPFLGPLATVAAGGNLIEKHFTLGNNLPGPDHRFALEPDELKLMVQKIREITSALGSSTKIPQPVEQELRQFARRSIFSVRELTPGEVLTRENIAVLRCGKLAGALEPVRFDDLLGRRVRRVIPAETALQEMDLSSKGGQDVTIQLRRATPEDCRRIWEWRNEPETRQASFNTNLIDYAEHEGWYRGALQDPDTALFLILNETNLAIGYIRIETKIPEAFIHVSLDPTERGKGYGVSAVRSACNYALRMPGVGKVTALIKKDNLVSKKAFEKAGFSLAGIRHVSNNEAYELVYQEGEVKKECAQ